MRNLEKHEKHQETSGFIDFSTFKMNFRSAPGLRAPPRFLICCVSKKEEIYDLETNGDADLTTDTTNDTGTTFDTDTNNDSDFDLGGAV